MTDSLIVFRQMMTPIKDFITRLCTAPQETLSYEQGYRLFYTYTRSNHGESYYLVLSAIPQWIASLKHEWAHPIDHIITWAYDIMLYPCRINKISPDKFRERVLMTVLPKNTLRHLIHRQTGNFY